MRLTYTCSGCKKQNYLKEKAETRPDLQMKIGKEEVCVNCDNCGKMDKKHLNQITAVVDNRMIFTGLIVGIISTLILWVYFGAIATVSFAIPLFFWIGENKALSGFNKYTIRRK
ncbi:MAG: hypothetical protein ABJN84_07510 [Flavobacteriaceae bacterium]